MALAPPAPAAGAFPPPPPLFSRCHSALSPALRSAPCPAALASGPETLAAGQPRLCLHLPRRALGSLFLPVSPAPSVSRSLPAGPCLRLRRLPSLSPAFLYPCPVSPLRVSVSLRSLPLSLSLPPTLGAAPAVSDPGPRLCRVPGLPGSPSSRRPRRAENSQLAARRPALRDFRPSSHVTRAPLRRPRAPTPSPGAPGGPRGPALPLLLSLARHDTPSHPPAARAEHGLSTGWGPRGPLLPEILPGFSSSLQEHSSQNPFRGCAPGFSRPPGAGGEGSSVLGREWVGEGRYRVR